MSRDATTEVGPTRDPGQKRREPASAVGLVVVWSAEGPHALGAFVPVVQPVTYGREGDATRIHQRPGENVALEAPSGNRLSRLQLRLAPLSGGRISVERLGRATVRVRGDRVEQAVLSPGDTLEIADHALFLCVQRPERLPPAVDAATLARFDAPFGGPDPFGLVGESPALWALRDRLAFVAPRPGHVLVLGPSGVGKELVARAVHRLSTRAGGPFVARNAATIPASLADAELFGHARHYPNTGMPERAGLVGEADGGTLLLDEIGELPEAQQAHLLRLMDAGEYQRLGEPRTRHAQLRIVAATNRPPEALKPDFLARFRHVIEVPPLAARREDLPLLCRHLLQRALSDDTALSARFSPDRVSVDLVEALLRHPLPLQMRALDALLWRCLAKSPGPEVDVVEDLDLGGPTDVSDEQGPAGVDPATIDAETLRAALLEHQGVQERVWRALGLQSRYQLRRLLKKHDLG
jgi:transcriptional regulator with AAA-type ATPase domain